MAISRFGTLELAVRLVDWRKFKGWTQAMLAAELGVSQPAISQFERAVNPIIPGPAVMVQIFQLTRGAVQPNDFYDLPALVAAREAA